MFSVFFLFSLQTMDHEEQGGVTTLLEQLEKQMEGEEGKEEEREEEGTPSLSASSVAGEEEEKAVEEGAELSDLEEELGTEEEIRLLHEQDRLLEQVCYFVHEMMNQNILNVQS